MEFSSAQGRGITGDIRHGSGTAVTWAAGGVTGDTGATITDARGGATGIEDILAAMGMEATTVPMVVATVAERDSAADRASMAEEAFTAAEVFTGMVDAVNR